MGAGSSVQDTEPLRLLPDEPGVVFQIPPHTFYTLHLELNPITHHKLVANLDAAQLPIMTITVRIAKGKP